MGIHSIVIPDSPIPINSQLYVVAIPPESWGYVGDPEAARPRVELYEDGSDLPLELDVDERPDDDALHWFVTPKDGFEPDTQYHLIAYQESQSDFIQKEVYFQTSSEFDSEAPAAPVSPELDAAYWTGVWLDDPPCSSGPASVITVHLPRPSATGGEVYEIEVAETKAFKDAYRTYSESGSAYIDAVGNRYFRLERAFVRARSMDLAGNRSEWSEVERVRVPLCSMASTSQGGALSFLLIGLAAHFGGRSRRRDLCVH